MAELYAYDPTRGYTVPVSQARVVAYVIDTTTGNRYNTVAEANKAAQQLIAPTQVPASFQETFRTVGALERQANLAAEEDAKKAAGARVLVQQAQAQAAQQAAQVTPSALAAQEGGAIGAASIASQIAAQQGGQPEPADSAPGKGLVTPSGKPIISTDATGEKPGKAWIFQNGQWVQPPKPTDDGVATILSERKLSNGLVSQIVSTISYVWDDNRGWRKTTKTETLRSEPAAAEALTEATKAAQDAAKTAAEAEAEAEAGKGEGPGEQPGKAWILSPDGKSWIKPTKPVDGEYDWNDETGWVKKTPPPGEGPGTQPGKAWILSPDGKSWVKPSMPTDGEYDWNDETGWVKKAPPPGGDGFKFGADGTLTNNGVPFTGTYNGKNYVNGVVQPDADAGEGADAGADAGEGAGDGVGGGAGEGDGADAGDGAGAGAGAGAGGTGTGGTVTKTVVSTYTDPVTGNVFAVYSDGTTAVLSKGTKEAELAAAEARAKTGEKAARQSAFDLLFSEFNRYGLGSLVEPLRGLIEENISPAEFAIRLRKTPAYELRFGANKARINRGLRALSEAEYITLEDSYQDIMRRYGLPETYYRRGELGRQEGFEKFISTDVSPVELEDRIQTAQNRIFNANPEVAIALKMFYPDISNGDILGYVLDPEKGLSNIKRRITAAEIGGSAVSMGLATNVTDAEYLARYGVTKEQAQQGYRTISEVLPRGSFLGEIYSKQGMGPYTQATAEQEVFNVPGAAEAATKRRKLSELEQAQFSGQSGVGALARERAGQF